jgi:hypothetical protein
MLFLEEVEDLFQMRKLMKMMNRRFVLEKTCLFGVMVSSPLLNLLCREVKVDEADVLRFRDWIYRGKVVVEMSLRGKFGWCVRMGNMGAKVVGLFGERFRQNLVMQFQEVV